MGRAQGRRLGVRCAMVQRSRPYAANYHAAPPRDANTIILKYPQRHIGTKKGFNYPST